MHNNTNRTLLQMDEVSKILGVSLGRAYELSRLNIIPTVKLGRQIRVDPNKLEEWINNGGKGIPN